MKKLALVFGVLFASVTTSHALTPVPHRALNTIVRLVDVERRIVTLKSDAKDEPTEFVVEEGRTRLRCDQKPATLKDLAVGQHVQLYYKREHGENVATEIAWSSGP